MARIVGGVRWVLFRAIYPVVGVGGETMGVGEGGGGGRVVAPRKVIGPGRLEVSSEGQGREKMPLDLF